VADYLEGPSARATDNPVVRPREFLLLAGLAPRGFSLEVSFKTNFISFILYIYYNKNFYKNQIVFLVGNKYENQK
jgi:hypothetical protein